MCIVALPLDSDHSTSDCAAHHLTWQQRRQIAVDALAGQSITLLAQQHKVSRKFVYLQLDLAHQALDHAFSPQTHADDDVLFYLPVTKPWIRQFVLALVLICHSSLRGVVELLADLFDYRLSLGSVHNIVHQAVASARRFNTSQNLADVAIGSHDEIFQASWPVLVGIDVYSTYCYLLSVEEHRDADTWGVRLLELVERDFNPDATIADGGPALRSGQKQALPEVPCRSDVFHVLRDVGTLVRRLENRAYEIMGTVQDLIKRQTRHQWRKGRKNLKFVQKLRHAQVALGKAITLADDVATLAAWLQRDVLAVTGASYPERCEMYEFIVQELFAREQLSPGWIGPVRTTLENQEEVLLGFAEQLEEDVARLARQWQTREKTVRELLQTQTMPMNSGKRWEEERRLRQELGGERYYGLSQDVKKLREQVVRASSVVENLNSRLRNYFFLRKQVGPDYLSLLQFFLNHRKFQRSEHAERQGKSPAELLTGKEHSHWLELLGYTRFSRC